MHDQQNNRVVMWDTTTSKESYYMIGLESLRGQSTVFYVQI